jgi:hypothetical protein
MFPLISSITPNVSVPRLADTHHQPPAASAVVASSVISGNQPCKEPTEAPLQRVFYIPWQTRRWSNSSWGGVWHGIKENLQSLLSEHKHLRKTAMLHFSLPPFCSWGCANSAHRLFHIAVLTSISHKLLIHKWF